MSWEEAAYYEVFSIWVEVDEKGDKTVVIQVQGVRTDGSFWVNGFNVRIKKDEFDKMTMSQIDALIRSEIARNEAELRKWRDLQIQGQVETDKLTQTDKYIQLKGRRYEKPTTT